MLVGAMVVVILPGTGSRRFPGLLPQALGKYPGDALWSVLVKALVKEP